MHAYITPNIAGGMHLKFFAYVKHYIYDIYNILLIYTFCSELTLMHNTQLDDDQKIASPWCLLNSTAAQGSHIGKSLLGKYLGNNCQKNDDRAV